MKTVSVIGHFGFGYDFIDGQTVKTKILTDELCRYYGEENVMKIDTHGGVKTLIKAPFQTLKALESAKNVIILPAHNGVRVFGRLLPLFRFLFKGRKIHYSVIGGWLPQFLEKRSGLTRSLKKFDGIYVETSTMKRALEEKGFNNVTVIPNFKNLTVLSPDELVYPEGEPYKLCTFSRVSKEKGIEDAVEAVKAVNQAMQRTVYQLDIYGPVDSEQTKWFEELQQDFPEFVKYRGTVPFDKSVEVLKHYFALLFPTHYFTEGIPGTIIDAYAAGVPVISAKWESCFDIVSDVVTGFVYDFDDQKQFENMLLTIAQKPEITNGLKINCIENANKFVPQMVVKFLVENFAV